MDGARISLMTLISEINASYRTPKLEMRRQIEDGIREEQTLFFALLFGLLSFLSLLPEIAKRAYIMNDSLPALAAAQFIASVFMMPLLMYGIAALSHIILAKFGGQGDYVGTRRALFWAAVVTSPVILASSVLSIYFPVVKISLAILTTFIFIWQWTSNLKELEFNNV
jgi:hypothetical protein